VLIKLNNGKQVNSGLIEKIILRSDLFVIPETLEVTLRYDKKVFDALKEGDSFKSGYDDNDYKIIKVEPFLGAPQGMSGDQAIASFRIIAILKQFIKLTYIQKKATIKSSDKLSAIYRSCGYEGNTANDMQAGKFSCFVGDFATIRIQKALQDLSVSPVWMTDTLKFVKNSEILSKQPSLQFESDTTTSINSEFLQRHEIPENYSTKGDKAKTIAGGTGKPRILEYRPREKESTLLNASKVLINKKILTSNYNASHKAGDVFLIAGKPFVVITALHSRGQNKEYSKYWLGVTT